jgi:hypothetical protein
MYRYASFKPPRNRVRRASGFVLTRHPDGGEPEVRFEDAKAVSGQCTLADKPSI